MSKFKILSLLLIIVIITTFVWAAGIDTFVFEEVTKNMSDNNPVIIDIRGDSIMAGFDGITYVTDTAPAVLQSVLRSYYNNDSITVVNNAIQGTGTNSNMSTWNANISTSTASVIIINFGINDMQGTPENPAISIKQYKDNLTSMVNTVKQYKKIPVLVTPNVITTFGTGSLSKSTRVKLFAETMKQVAKETDVKMIDLHSYTEQYLKSGVNIPSLFPDGLHPSGTLYKAIGLALADIFINSPKINENDIIPAVSYGARYSGGANVILSTPTSIMGYGIIANKIKIPVYIEESGLDIYVASAIWNYGTPSCNIKIDLNSVATISNYDINKPAPYNYTVDNEIMVIENATQGMHYIEMDAQNNENTGFYYVRAYKTN
jgi:lysophospholipase L1-like esterase